MEMEPDLAMEANSAKKVRRPLFQEPMGQMVDQSEVALAETSNLNTEKQLSVSEDVDNDDVMGDDLGQQSIAVDGDLATDVEEDFTDSVTAAVLVELELADDLHSQEELTDLEQVNFHAELVEKVHYAKVVKHQNAKPVIEKMASRNTTPLWGISARKLVLVGTKSPRKAPKTYKPKEGKAKEQDKGSLKHIL